MKEVTGSSHYCYKSYTYQFVCPECGKTQRHNTNFLGQRNVVCTGLTTAKVKKGDETQQFLRSHQ